MGGCQQEVKMSEKKKESGEVGRLRDLWDRTMSAFCLSHQRGPCETGEGLYCVDVQWGFSVRGGSLVARPRCRASQEVNLSMSGCIDLSFLFSNHRLCGGAAHKLHVWIFCVPTQTLFLLPPPPDVVCVPIKLRANSKQTVDESVKESATHMFFFTSSGLEPIN